MIERMRRVSMLLLGSGTAGFLQKLQELGAVHLENETFAAGPELTGVLDELLRLRKTEQALAQYKDHTPDAAVEYFDADGLCDAADTLISEITHLHVEYEKTAKEIRQIAPWGEFDPGILEKLEPRGLRFSFHALSHHKFSQTDLNGYHVEIISSDKGMVYFLILLRPGEEISDPSLQPESFRPQSLSVLQAAHDDLKLRIDEKRRLLAGLYGYRRLLDERIALLEDRREYLLARLGLQPEAGGHVMRLSGYIPLSKEAELAGFLQTQDAVYVAEDPGRDEPVPVKLKNRPFARLFEPITKIFGLPAYTELDTTPFMAPFFALFFGMCMADLGYGIIVILLAAAALIFLKKKSMKPLAVLGLILGIMTVAGGIVLDTLFGVKITGINGFPEGVKKLVLFPDINSAMYFAIMLGVIQVLFGFILRMINQARQSGITGILQPAGTFMLIAGAVIFLIGKMAPDLVIGPFKIWKLIAALGNAALVSYILIAAGILLILLFNNVRKKIWIRPLTGLWELYGIASGIPGDIISYIRLFALSLAGGLLGGAINQIALMVRGDHATILTVIPMLLILAGGHALNFALAALSAFVHPLRLTFVEFYKAVGFTGGGKPYRPFVKKYALDGGK